MEEAKEILQNKVLNKIKTENKTVTIFLLNGRPLKGKIKNTDKFTILLQTEEGQEMLVYKHAIATVIL